MVLLGQKDRWHKGCTCKHAIQQDIVCTLMLQFEGKTNMRCTSESIGYSMIITCMLLLSTLGYASRHTCIQI
jgi:hypothetical protein